jgi:signal transduction histidine kinase
MDTPTPGRIAQDKGPLVSDGRILYASIVALALGVIPILMLSDRMGLHEVHHSRLIFCNVLLAAAVCGYFLVRDGHRQLAALLLVSVLWLGVTAFAFYTGIGLHSSVMFLYIVAILYTSLLCGLVPATMQTALTVGALTALYWAETNGWIGGIHAYMEKTTPFNYYLGVVVSCIGALVVATAYHRAVEHAVRSALEANRKLEGMNGELERMVTDRTRELEATIHELESFNYSVSHDLRAPLRAIHGHASRLGESGADALAADQVRQLERIAAEAQRMDTLLMALLGFGRISRRPLAFTEVNLTAMTARIAEEFAAAPQGARTRFTIHPEMKVQADRHLMHAVLENLVGNALKFSHGHEAPAIEVGRESTNGGEAFYVRDNGAGFDPAFASHLYKPFHRLHADSEFSGIGMGLASARRIIERHGGRIWAESAPGKGATFYFTLPQRRG